MKSRSLGKSGLEVSALGFGCRVPQVRAVLGANLGRRGHRMATAWTVSYLLNRNGPRTIAKCQLPVSPRECFSAQVSAKYGANPGHRLHKDTHLTTRDLVGMIDAIR